ncbi:hypothetical protein GGX14DRAFT_491841, partial [Mycena pura]
MATLYALPRELAHWATTPMTPPHTDTVEPRRLWARSALDAYAAHPPIPLPPAPVAYAVHAYSAQLLTPPDDTSPLDEPMPPPHSRSHSQHDAQQTDSQTNYHPPYTHHGQPPLDTGYREPECAPPDYRKTTRTYDSSLSSYAPPTSSLHTTAAPPPVHRANDAHSHPPTAADAHSSPDSEAQRETVPAADARVGADADTNAPLAWARDWLRVARARPESAALVAEKTCEMICYLWFAPTPLSAARDSENESESSGGSRSGSGSGEGRSTPSALQLAASSTFVKFTQKLLETTQLSQSAIVLALHYIHRLRARNAGTPAQPGSEFRVAVAGLMMANKFLDDNTYTNATWAAVSAIPLPQINTMEREFLAGCGYSLFVSQKVYEDWGRLLKGLVGARERARGAVGRHHKGGRMHGPHTPHARRVANAHCTPSRRRKSISPTPRARAWNEDVEMHEATEEQEREERERERREKAREAEVGSKRRAAAAFSPGSYHPPAHPHPSFAAAGTHAQSQAATTPTPSHHSTYVNGAPLPTHAPQTQRPAPTLVIPSQQLQSQFAYPRSAGHAGWSPVDSVPPSFTTQHAGTPQTYSSGGSSSSSGSATSARAYTSTSLATPLERFGAMSLSTRRRTPSPPREREREWPRVVEGERGPAKRERPVSYAGSTAASTGVGAGGGLMAFAERYAGATCSPSSSVHRAPATPERGRERSTWGTPASGPVRSTSAYPSPMMSTATQYKLYVPPAPSTIVQYPPQHSYGESAATTTLPPIAVAYGPYQQQPAQTQQHTTYSASQLATPVKTQQHSTVVSAQPATLTARWDYVARSCAAQDLYFYTLASSPVSTSSASESSGDDADEEIDSDDSGLSDDGRGSDAELVECDYRPPQRAPVQSRPRSRALSDSRERDPVRVREEARRARLRYAPAPAPTAASWLPLPSQPHGVLAAQNHFGADGGRWGVQSARTSPVRGAPPVIKTEWTPPRAAYADVGAGGAGAWTPPRVALPRFADLERWSSGARARTQHQPAPEQQQAPPPSQQQQ